MPAYKWNVVLVECKCHLLNIMLLRSQNLIINIALELLPKNRNLPPGLLHLTPLLFVRSVSLLFRQLLICILYVALTFKNRASYI